MPRFHLLAAVLIAGIASAETPETAPAKAAHNHVEARPATIEWGASPAGLPPGAQGALLEGDPAKAGYFALRLKVPGGYKIMPHTHPGDERVTVLEGTLYLGVGERWDESTLQEFPPGSYVSIPKGHKHFAFFKQAGIIQLNSLGPWGITYINPKDDPRKAQGPRPSR